jgi:hypothetical protein
MVEGFFFFRLEAFDLIRKTRKLDPENAAVIFLIRGIVEGMIKKYSQYFPESPKINFDELFLKEVLEML